MKKILIMILIALLFSSCSDLEGQINDKIKDINKSNNKTEKVSSESLSLTYKTKVCVNDYRKTASSGKSMGRDGSLKDFYLEKVSFEEIEVGDVIVYDEIDKNSKYGRVKHRVITKSDNYVLTKGDANDYVDPLLVTEDLIVGRECRL